MFPCNPAHLLGWLYVTSLAGHMGQTNQPGTGFYRLCELIEVDQSFIGRRNNRNFHTSLSTVMEQVQIVAGILHVAGNHEITRPEFEGVESELPGASRIFYIGDLSSITIQQAGQTGIESIDLLRLLLSCFIAANFLWQ